MVDWDGGGWDVTYASTAVTAADVAAEVVLPL